MSEGGEKVHDATPKRTEDALAKGDTPASREVVLLGSLGGIALATPWLGETFSRGVSGAVLPLWHHADAAALADGEAARELLGRLAAATGGALAPVLGTIAAGGLVAALLQRPRVAAKRVTPDPSRLSLIKGFTRVLGPAGLFEFAKSVVKIGVVGAILGWMLWPRMPDALRLVDADPALVPAAVGAQLSGAAIRVALLLAPLALADALWTRHRWRSKLRMTHEEMREETKGSEGDPAVKGRRMSLRRARARHSMVAAVDGASFVVANPTHYAVALRYEKGRDGAPVVVAKGRDHVALRIRERAEKGGLPVFEVPPLARALHAQVGLHQAIPEEFYGLVAALVRRLETIE